MWHDLSEHNEALDMLRLMGPNPKRNNNDSKSLLLLMMIVRQQQTLGSFDHRLDECVARAGKKCHAITPQNAKCLPCPSEWQG